MNQPITATPPRSASQELEDHAHFLRALARRLVKDASTADDIAQETLVAAVTSTTRRSDLTGLKARPWMAQVLRRKAANEWRTNSRRSQREDAAARPEATRSTFDTVAQIDLAERLLGHVRGLDPVMQDAIIGRFYRGMSLKELASEAGLPVTTIQSRIGRGLEKMRAKLDAEEPGGRSAWLSGLAAFSGVGNEAKVAAGAAAGTSAVAAATGRTIAWWAAGAAAGLAAVAGAVILWMETGGQGSGPPSTETAWLPSASGASVPDDFEGTLKVAGEAAAGADVASAMDQTQARVELPVTVAEAGEAAIDGWNGVVTYFDNDGVKWPAEGAVVEWDTQESRSSTGSLTALGYSGEAVPLAAPSNASEAAPARPSAITSASGGFTMEAVPSDARLTVKVPGDKQYRAAEWSGTGANWANAPEPIELTRIPHGALRGKVVDYEGRPLAEVPISLNKGGEGAEYEVETDSEGAFALPHFSVKYPRAILREAIRLPGYTVIGHEEPEALEQGGWRPLTIVLARTGSVRVALSESSVASRELTLAVSPIDPVQVRPKFQRFAVDAVVGPDGVGHVHGAPIGPALQVKVGGSTPYEYELDGVAHSRSELMGKDVPSTWTRIRVPASGTLDLQVPNETSATIHVAAVRPDGTPAEGAMIMAFTLREGRDVMDHLRFHGEAGEDGKEEVVIKSLLKTGPVVMLVANDMARASVSEGRNEVPFGAAFWNPASASSEEILLQTQPVESALGRIILPKSATAADPSRTRVRIVTLAPASISEAPLHVMYQDFSSAEINAKGEFEFMTMPGFRYRVEAQHEGFEDVSFDFELDPGSSPVNVAFEAPVDLAEVTVHLVTQGDDEARRLLKYGPSPEQTRFLELDQDTSTATLHVPPGRLWLSGSGRQSALELQSPDSGYHTIPKGSTEITLTLRPRVIAAGSLRDAPHQAPPLFLQMVPEGRSAPLHVEVGLPNHSTPWIEADPQGRFRCECPTGSYTAWIGTRNELRAGQPRRRTPFTVTPGGLAPTEL